jgi:LAO/AO transport system kinase
MSRAPGAPGAASPSLDEIRGGDRRAIAKAITLLESTRPDQAAAGQALLEALVPYTGQATRVGITGPPGVGKSSFIETLGMQLLGRDERVAVLAVDPSSPVTGGSILGDKTRMERLAQEERAFIRPSPSGGLSGGVAHRTREAMLVCEAAGFSAVLVETVGIGQSEVAVASMVDFFLVLLQPGAGDDLQGIKKGLVELADGLVVNKADGETKAAAERTLAEYGQALGLLRQPSPGSPSSASWRPQILAASAATGEGVEAAWEMIQQHRALLMASGELEARRREQARAWMWSLVEEGLRASFRSHPAVAERLRGAERDVEAQRTSPAAAARALLQAFREGDGDVPA